MEGEAVQAGDARSPQPPSVRSPTTALEEIALEVPIHTQPTLQQLRVPALKGSDPGAKLILITVLDIYPQHCVVP